MKMKKLLIILLVLTFVCGCTNIENYNYDDLVNMMDNKPKSANTFRKGYKYYVPKKHVFLLNYTLQNDKILAISFRHSRFCLQ